MVLLSLFLPFLHPNGALLEKLLLTLSQVGLLSLPALMAFDLYCKSRSPWKATGTLPLLNYPLPLLFLPIMGLLSAYLPPASLPFLFSFSFFLLTFSYDLFLKKILSYPLFLNDTDLALSLQKEPFKRVFDQLFDLGLHDLSQGALTRALGRMDAIYSHLLTAPFSSSEEKRFAYLYFIELFKGFSSECSARRQEYALGQLPSLLSRAFLAAAPLKEEMPLAYLEAFSWLHQRSDAPLAIKVQLSLEEVFKQLLEEGYAEEPCLLAIFSLLENWTKKRFQQDKGQDIASLTYFFRHLSNMLLLPGKESFTALKQENERLLAEFTALQQVLLKMPAAKSQNP
jgi:hypothetical protein